MGLRSAWTATRRKLTALHLAAASGNVEAVRSRLTQPPADPKAARNNNFTPLHSAAMQGHAAVCELLIGGRGEVNVQTNPQGCMPAARRGVLRHVEAIRVLFGPWGGSQPGELQRAARGHGSAYRTKETVRVLEA